MKFNIASKIILLSSLLIILTSSAIAFSLIKVGINQVHQSLMEKGKLIASIMAENSEYGVYTEDKESLIKIAQSLLEDDDIHKVGIFDKQKESLIEGTSDTSLMLSPLRYSQDEFAFSDTLAADIKMFANHVEIIAPIVSLQAGFEEWLLNEENVTKQRTIIGYLQLGITLEHLHKKIRVLVLSTVVFTAFFVLLGIGLAVYIARKITGPLRTLQTASQRIADNKLDHFVEIKSNDEIFDLAESFNNMIKSLKQYKVKIENQTNTLKKEVTTRKSTEISLAATKAQLQHLMKNTPAVIYSCKPSNEFQCNFIGENVKNICRYTFTELINDHQLWVVNIHKDDVWHYFREKERLMTSEHIVIEYRVLNSEGNYIWVLDEMNLIYDSKGMPFEIIGYILEITERKGLEEKLINDAIHDPLTGLPNRVVLLDKLAHYLALAQKKSGHMFALLFMDLDRFKKVNDSLGHDIGDKLLVLVSEKLRNCIYASDIVVRLGGDEFAIILQDIKSIDEIVAISERILKELSNPFYIENQEIFLTGSIGITINNMDYDNPSQLLRDADLAMYNAKAKGGGCYALFDAVMHEKAINMMQIETDLQHVIEREQLFLLYQPIISGTTGMVEGFEALVRWNHPQRGLINPLDFIPIAEDTGLIIPIGYWVLSTACQQMSIWQKEFPTLNKLTVSVNISSKQFTTELIQQINSVLLKTGINADSLILEITESVIMDNPDLTAKIIMDLHDIHIRLQIDDFGTGYSSLSYLHHFPVDALKIDRSFVKRMNDDSDKLEIVKLIIAMAHNLKMNVVAEGIETIEQYDQLNALDCEYLQGYFFSKPISVEDIETFLRQNHNFSTHLISQ